jgi:hypothetical protein
MDMAHDVSSSHRHLLLITPHQVSQRLTICDAKTLALRSLMVADSSVTLRKVGLEKEGKSFFILQISLKKKKIKTEIVLMNLR